MHRRTLVLMLLLALGACSKREASEGATAQALAAPAMKSATAPDRQLAYEHSLTLDVEDRDIASTFQAAEAGCRADAEDLCVILDSRIDTGPSPSASLRLRAKAAGIRRLIGILVRNGGVVHQSTTAEDLTGPIEDGTKRLAMLNDYRSRLEALRGRAGSDVDSLIKVNHELAEVQSDIEAAAGAQGSLQQRAQTEILDVSFGSLHRRSFWKPIGQATADFRSNLSQAVAGVITALAYLIPWMLLVLALGWVVRRLWFRRRREHKPP
jgi:hypothetical protein